MNRTVLICDNDMRDSAVLKQALVSEGFDVVQCYNMQSARSALARRGVDLIISEYRLPDGDGLELCRYAREILDTAFIFISARGDELERILGLKMGADDYISKPFSPMEAAARAEAVLRRSGRRSDSSRAVELGGLRMYPDSFTASVGEEKLELIPSDFKLLLYLVSNEGKVLSREKMLDAVWGFEYYGSQRSVDTQIKRIRAALKGKNVQIAIHSIYGIGYKLDCEGKGN